MPRMLQGILCIGPQSILNKRGAMISHCRKIVALLKELVKEEVKYDQNKSRMTLLYSKLEEEVL
jgi:hypothetical protein